MGIIEISPIKTDNVEGAVAESNKVFEVLRAIDVKDQASYESVADIRKTVNAKIKELDAERKGITGPIDLAKKKVMDLFRKPTDICKEIVKTCDVLMIAWTDLQEKKRKDEQDRLDRAAEKKRLELEVKAKTLREEGKEDKADRVEEKATEVIAPIAAPRVEKPQGVHYTAKWYGDVTDFALLSDEYKIINQPMINKIMQATKGTISILGVKARSEKIVNSRG